MDSDFKSRIMQILKKNTKNIPKEYKEDLINVIDAELDGPIESISEMSNAISRYIIDDFKDDFLSFTDLEISLIDPLKPKESEKVLIEDYEENLVIFITNEISKGHIDTANELATKIIDYMQRDIEKNIIQFNLRGGIISPTCFIPWSEVSEEFESSVTSFIKNDPNLKGIFSDVLLKKMVKRASKIMSKWVGNGWIFIPDIATDDDDDDEPLFLDKTPAECFQSKFGKTNLTTNTPPKFKEALFFEIWIHFPRATDFQIANVAQWSEIMVGKKADEFLFIKNSNVFINIIKGSTQENINVSQIVNNPPKVGTQIAGGQDNDCSIPFDKSGFMDSIESMIITNNKFLKSEKFFNEIIPENLIKKTTNVWGNIFSNWENKGLIKSTNDDSDFGCKGFTGNLDGLEDALFYELGKGVPELNNLQKAELLRQFETPENIEPISIVSKIGPDFKNIVKGKNLSLRPDPHGTRGFQDRIIKGMELKTGSGGECICDAGIGELASERNGNKIPINSTLRVELGGISPLQKSAKQLLEDVKNVKLTKKDITKIIAIIIDLAA